MSNSLGKKISLPEMNARINELLKQSIKSEGVINLFSDIKEEFSLFDPKFLQEVANMKEKNLAVELLKKLIAEQVSVYRRTNVVKSEKFSEIMQRSLNAYLNGMLTNEEVIEEMLKLAKQIAAAQKEGDQLGLKMIRKVSLYRVSLVRLVVIPIVTLFLLWFVPNNLMEMKIAILIASACPVGSNVAVYTQLHEKDHPYAVETVVISIITIPAVINISGIW